MTWNPNPTGKGGFRDHPEHATAVHGAEAVRRGTTGGTRSGRVRHNTAKWRAVEGLLARCKAGEAPTWSLLADFYDAVYKAGYSSQWNTHRRRRQAKKASAAA